MRPLMERLAALQEQICLQPKSAPAYPDGLTQRRSPGDLEKAKPLLEEAQSIAVEVDMRPLMERLAALQEQICLQPKSAPAYPDGLTQRRSPGDLEKAKPLLEEAQSIAVELGMRPLMKRVAAIQEQIRLQPKSAPAYPDGLTQREVEVPCLIANGKTDRDIAEELVIAESTVRRHVSNIYAKIGQDWHQQPGRGHQVCSSGRPARYKGRLISLVGHPYSRPGVAPFSRQGLSIPPK